MKGRTRRMLNLPAVGLSSIAIFALAGLTFPLGSGPCDAGDHILGPSLQTQQMPWKGTKAKGFTTQVEMSEENSVGYIPVKIVFKSVGTLTADRRLIYRFQTSPGGQSPPGNGLMVDVPITVSQGTTTRTFVRYLPKWSAGQAIEVSVWEDGQALEDYLAYFGTPLPQRSRAPLEMLQTEHEINWLFISSADFVAPETMPDLRGIAPAALLSQSGSSQAGSAAESTSLDWSKVMHGPQLLALGQQELPDDWRAYQRYDAIVIASEGLEQLRLRDSEYEAVRNWILNGGTIVIYDAVAPEPVLEQLNFAWTRDGDAAGRLRSIASDLNAQIEYRERKLKDEVTALRAKLDQDKAMVKAYAAQAEYAPYQSQMVARIRENEQSLQKAQNSLGYLTLSREGHYVDAPIYTVSQWSRQIWMQPAGAGNVIGIRASDRYDVPPVPHWRIVSETIDYRASPMLRRGVDPILGNGRFTNWLIPGVAQPPVYTFIGLLTGFVVLVGPIAYRRTAKYGRSYLMFGIAPILALITTLAMFGYGIISDGFGTVVRARQLTWVDGRSGDAGERIRATYFAGVRPDEGLRFPGRAEVCSYPEGMGQSWEDLNKLSPAILGSVVVRPDAQQFDSSFLPSRQQRQFVLHAPRHNVGSMKLVRDPNRIRAPRIESSLKFMLHQAVLRDPRGVYWYVEKLAPGQSVECQPLQAIEASKKLGQLYTDHRPLSRVRESRRRNRYSGHTYDVLVATYRLIDRQINETEGLFEEWLREHLQTSGEIPRNHFVATADVSPDAVAVDDCELVDGIRYVFGTLR